MSLHRVIYVRNISPVQSEHRYDPSARLPPTNAELAPYFHASFAGWINASRPRRNLLLPALALSLSKGKARVRAQTDRLPHPNGRGLKIFFRAPGYRVHAPGGHYMGLPAVR